MQSPEQFHAKIVALLRALQANLLEWKRHIRRDKLREDPYACPSCAVLSNTGMLICGRCGANTALPPLASMLEKELMRALEWAKPAAPHA